VPKHRVWKNRHLSILTKVRVYEACVLSILLYGSETWATYRCQESKLSAFHTRSLRYILGKSWKDKMTNKDVFQLTGSVPLFSKLKFLYLRWAGHLNRMPKHRIPHILFHGVLSEGSCQTGRPYLRFKDVLKRDLKDFDINSSSFTTLSYNRAEWRQNLHTGQTFDSDNSTKSLMARRARHQH